MSAHERVKTQVQIFKNIACSLALVIASMNTATANEQGEGGPPGLQKKGGVPPGLQKKGGVPPGQAKKHTVETSGPAAAASQPSAPSPATPPAVKPADGPKALEAAPQPATVPQKTVKNQAAHLEDLASAINAAAEKPQVLQQTLAFVSRQTGFTVKQLQQQHEKFPRMGASAFLLGNIIAIHSKHEFRDLAVQKLKGHSWAQIATANGIAVSLLVQKAEGLARAIGVAEHAAR